MPGMHTSIAFLFALPGRCVNRRLGIALAGHAGLITLGGIHLGLHYAIDCYAGIAGLWLVWLGVGRLQTTFAAMSPIGSRRS